MKQIFCILTGSTYQLFGKHCAPCLTLLENQIYKQEQLGRVVWAIIFSKLNVFSGFDEIGDRKVKLWRKEGKVMT